MVPDGGPPRGGPPRGCPPRGLPRLVDVLVAAVALVVVGPLLVLLAAIVKATSDGPVLFRQARLGLGGLPFTLLKLRSMRVSAEGASVTASGDSRVTPVGRLLRRLKLDELPQLWNVLIGDMALVGPRPEVPEFVDGKSPEWRRILSVRPGLTDPVTVRLRNEEGLLASAVASGLDAQDFYRRHLLPWKVRGYLAYLDRRSAGGDFGIILRTVGSLARTGDSPTLEDLVELPIEDGRGRASASYASEE